MAQTRGWRELHWFIWFAVPVLVFGLICAYAALDPQDYQLVFESQSWKFEFTVVVIPLASALIAVHLLTNPVVRSDIRPLAWVLLLILGALFLAAEDTGWGRDIFDASYPGWWPGDEGLSEDAEVDRNKEAIRALLQAAAVFVGFFFPLLAWAFPGRVDIFSWFRMIWPTYVCIPVLAMSVLSRFPREVAQARGGIMEEVGSYHNEVGEMFIYLFLLIYVLSLHRRLGYLHQRSP